VKFAAVVFHEGEKKMTKFLSLDKCLPRREFLQVRGKGRKEEGRKRGEEEGKGLEERNENRGRGRIREGWKGRKEEEGGGRREEREEREKREEGGGRRRKEEEGGGKWEECNLILDRY
jgi:hypothetical protein